MLVTTLSIYIVNWNSGTMLQQCILSIKPSLKDDFVLSEIIVIDNNSKDGFPHYINNCGLPITKIINTKNHGFAAACNQGATGGKSDFLLFLNPDTRLSDNAISEPLSFMIRPENARVGICGIQHKDKYGGDRLSYSVFPTAWFFAIEAFGINKLLPHKKKRRYADTAVPPAFFAVDQVIGAFFITRRAVFEELGGFDERFFVYFEEIDFALRARKRNWSVAFLTNVSCIHFGGGSSQQNKSVRLFHFLRSRLLYGFKHFRALSALAVLVITFVPEFFTRIVYSCRHGVGTDMLNILRSYSLLVRNLPAILWMAFKNRNGLFQINDSELQRYRRLLTPPQSS